MAASATLTQQRGRSGDLRRGPSPKRAPTGGRDFKAEEVMSHKLSTALLSADKAELDRLLSEISAMRNVPSGSASDPQALVGLLGRAVRCAVRQYLVRAELRSLALTDELTGLYNRRGFLVLAQQQMKLARRKKSGVLLFFADLDGLKQINDSLGHLEGDLALVRTAEALRETFRDSDIVARLGGDEFAVLAIEASDESDDDMQRRLESNLQTASIADPRYALSLSVGVARFAPDSPVSIGALLVQADQAMYEKKRSRSTPVVRESPPATCLAGGPDGKRDLQSD